MALLSLSDTANSVIAGGRSPITRSVITAGADIKPGFTVQAETLPDVGLSQVYDHTAEETGTNFPCYGVAIERTDLDIDTVFADNTDIEIVLIGSGTIIRMCVLAASGTFTAGEKMYLSKTTGGYIMPYQACITATAPTVDQNAGMHQSFIGIAQEDYANDASDDGWVEVLI